MTPCGESWYTGPSTSLETSLVEAQRVKKRRTLIKCRNETRLSAELRQLGLYLFLQLSAGSLHSLHVAAEQLQRHRHNRTSDESKNSSATEKRLFSLLLFNGWLRQRRVKTALVHQICELQRHWCHKWFTMTSQTRMKGEKDKPLWLCGATRGEVVQTIWTLPQFQTKVKIGSNISSKVCVCVCSCKVFYMCVYLWKHNFQKSKAELTKRNRMFASFDNRYLL